MSTKYFKQEPQPATYMDSQTDTDKKLALKIQGWKEDSEGWVGTWEDKQDKWHKMRMRHKKTKTFPFSGCANIRMPTIETKLRKIKAAIMNVITGVRPVVQVLPSPSGSWEGAKKVEKFLDHMLMETMQIRNKMIIAIDQMLEKGFYMLKPYWKVEIVPRVETVNIDDLSDEEAQWIFAPERQDEEVVMAVAQKFSIDKSPRVSEENEAATKKAVEEFLAGAEEVEFKVQDVIYDCPDVALCSPERVYVPTTSGYDPQDCEYIIHEFLLPYDTVKANAELKGWNKLAADEIKLKHSVDLTDKTLDITKDEREGIERLQSGNNLVRVWECYCWCDINGDGVKEKAVVTVAPDFTKVLRKISLPFYSGKYPFVKLFYELTDDRWFSHRGIPEIIEDIVKEIDVQHMQKIDYGTIANTPMFTHRAGMIGKNTVQFMFGQSIPVHGMQPLQDTLSPINKHNPNVEFSYKDEQMILEGKIEELLGQVDFNLQSMINKRQPRTLGEVELQQQSMQTVFSLDSSMITEQFGKLANWCWELWCQYGDDNYEFMYFGQDAQPQQQPGQPRGKGESIKMSKEELQGKYTITIRGNDQNTNPQVRLQKAQAILADTYQAFQMGLAAPENVINARKRALQELGVSDWEEMVMPQRPPQPPPPPPDDIKFKAEDLTDAEKAQALQKRGIQPDVEGRRLNEENRRDELEFDQLEKVSATLGRDKPRNEGRKE